MLSLTSLAPNFLGIQKSVNRKDNSDAKKYPQAEYIKDENQAAVIIGMSNSRKSQYILTTIDYAEVSR
jgi:hypothetical protein